MRDKRERDDLHDASDEQHGERAGVACRELPPLHELQDYRVACQGSAQQLNNLILTLNTAICMQACKQLQPDWGPGAKHA